MTQDQRAGFEAFMSDNGKYPQAIERNANGDYLLMTAASNWHVWQAAINSDRQKHQTDETLIAVYAAFGIGTAARAPDVLMTNINNVKRRANCLSAIERSFFMVPGEPDEDFPHEDPPDECLLNWGHDPDQYVEAFGKALADRQQRGEADVMRYMPEILAALKATGQNISLVQDIEGVLSAHAQPAVPDTIYLGCARMGLAGASDEEVLRYVRIAKQRAADLTLPVTPEEDEAWAELERRQ